MWLADGTSGDLPTGPWELLAYVIGVLLTVAGTIFVNRLRREPEPPDPQPQATQEIAQSAVEAISRATQQHIDALSSDNERLRNDMTSLRDELAAVRKEKDALYRENAELSAENEQWEARFRFGGQT